MKMFNLNARLARRATATVALGLLLGAQPAIACTVNNWNGGNSGNVTAGGPNSGGIARYAGICSMETAASSTSWVQDDSPGGIDRIRARFYVLADNTSTARIYRGFNDAGSAIFEVALNPGNGNISLISLADGVGVTCSDCAEVGSWNSIEIDWNAGAGNMSISVNGGAPDAATISTLSTVSSVRLGNLDGAGGTLNFDAYESRRTTEIGRLCEGDAFVDGVRDFADINAIFVEFATGGSNPAPGTPDITEDGLVDFADINEVFVLFATGQGACPNA